jgi:hypothetical protein
MAVFLYYLDVSLVCLCVRCGEHCVWCALRMPWCSHKARRVCAAICPPPPRQQTSKPGTCPYRPAEKHVHNSPYSNYGAGGASPYSNDGAGGANTTPLRPPCADTSTPHTHTNRCRAEPGWQAVGGGRAHSLGQQHGLPVGRCVPHRRGQGVCWRLGACASWWQPLTMIVVGRCPCPPQTHTHTHTHTSRQRACTTTTPPCVRRWRTTAWSPRPSRRPPM